MKKCRANVKDKQNNGMLIFWDSLASGQGP